MSGGPSDVERTPHLDERGEARMVDVGAKAPTRRTALASGRLRTTADALEAIVAGRTPKGDAFAVARLAGIQAAKRTPDLVPLCHPIPLEHVAVRLDADGSLPGVRVEAEVAATARTGVEMEALSAVAGALLALYDMTKGLDRGGTIEAIRLERKAGGRSGEWSAR